MQLFQSWRDSLKIFIPQNFKLFSLVTLNASFMTYKVWLRNFWGLFVISFVADLFHLLPFHLGPLHLSLSALVSVAAKFLLFMTLALSLRPSVKKKNVSYFLDYTGHVGLLGLLFFIKTIVFQIISRMGAVGADLFATSLFVPFYVVFMTILLMFYFDTPGSLKDFVFSYIRLLKMVWFGLPFIILLVWGFHLTYWLIFYFFGLGLFPFVTIVRSAPSSDLAFFYWALIKHVLIFIAVVPAAFAANFYTKRLHDDYKRYF